MEQMCAENYNKHRNEFIFFKLQPAFWEFQTITVSGCCWIKVLPYILLEKIYIYILALEMASPGNHHCANCIGAHLFAIMHV